MVLAPAAAAPAAVLLLLRMYTPLCLIDMVEEATSVTRLLMTPLVRAVMGMLESALALLLQAKHQEEQQRDRSAATLKHPNTGKLYG
jgi:hypothetical protein